MAAKAQPQVFFETALKWTEGDTGVVSITDTPTAIEVSAPAAFGGDGKHWSPEHFFLASISSCFMSTFLVFAKKLNLTIADFNCQAVGTVELVNGQYKFTKVSLYPKVTITDEAAREKAYKALERTYKYCIISNSINAVMTYHSQVINPAILTPS